MKAIVYESYGSFEVLKLKEVEKPVPKDDEVFVRIHASSINSADYRYMRAKPFFIRLTGQGVFRPKKQILGVDIAGEVESVGNDVERFKPGDEVYGELFANGMGGFAEYVCAPESEALSIKPKNMTFEQAAAVPDAAIAALQALRDKGQVQAGQKVLINGAARRLHQSKPQFP